MCHTCNTIHIQQAVILLEYVTVNYHLVFSSDYRKTPLRSHPLLGQWTGQPKHYTLHLPHGTSPSTKTSSASGPQKEHQRKYSHPTHRDCSEEMLNSTFYHEPLTQSLVPTARYSWKANHNTWPQPLIWNNPANVHNKATASHQTAQHLSRNLKMRLLWFGLCLRQNSMEGLGIALPKTPSWWLAKRTFLFSGLWVFSSLPSSDLH